MTEKVTRLFGQPDLDAYQMSMVDMLESTLEMVRAGQVTALIIGLVKTDGFSRSNSVWQPGLGLAALGLAGKLYSDVDQNTNG